MTKSKTAPRRLSRGTLGFIAFALLCLLPLSSDGFVLLIGRTSGASDFLAYALAWSASFAMGLIVLAGIGLVLVVWHLLSECCRS